jgi:hypothetical protein
MIPIDWREGVGIELSQESKKTLIPPKNQRPFWQTTTNPNPPEIDASKL